MKICSNFVNGHCAFECPNIDIDLWENWYELDAYRELGIERVSCKECQYNDSYMTCEDCYFYDTPDCPKHELK